MINDFKDGAFHVLFVTTPARLGTARFVAYFAQAQIDQIRLKFVLKRREPTQERDAQGRLAMSWGPSCSEEAFEKGARALVQSGREAWINIEGELRPMDIKLLQEEPSLGAIVSGHELSPQEARSIIEKLPQSSPLMLALENESMMLSGSSFIDSGRLTGLVVGTSYFSESSKIYDQMGLEKYRSLMRGLAKRAALRGARPYTTSNYCTFDPAGVGDKNKSFVAEQVDFVSGHEGWGSITRFYSHLDVAQKARLNWFENKREPR